jgi:spore coat protein U-like protein
MEGLPMRAPVFDYTSSLIGAVLFILTALVLMGLPSRAAAQACSFSVSNINFGSVSPVAVGTTVDATGTLSVDCSNLGLLHLTPVTIGVCPNLDAGSGGSNSSGRLMSGTGGTIPYQIYQDAGRTTPWGAAAFLFFNSVPTVILTSDSSGAIHATRTLYARVTNQRSSPSGSYSSTFTGQTFYWGLTIASCGVATVGTIGTPQPFTVSVSVPVDCLLTTGALDFGSKGLLTTTVAAQAAITVACTSGAPYSIALGSGLTGTGPTARRMTKGSGAITYGLYKDAAHTLPWGDAAAGAGTLVSSTGTGSSQSTTVYGAVPAQTTPAPGAYSDSVVITLTY